MKHIAIISGALIMATTGALAEQSIYIDQVNSSDGLTLTINQSSGDGNQVGQPLAADPYFSLDGSSQTITIDQYGASNRLWGEFGGLSATLDIDQTGSSNDIDLVAAGIQNSNWVFNLTGSSNVFDVDVTAGDTADIDFVYVGDTNDTLLDMSNDGGTVNVNLTGDGNDYDITTSGYGTSLAGHEITVTSIGSYNTVALTQSGTLNANVIDLDITGDNQSITVTQSD